MGQPAFLDDLFRVLEHRVGLGREAGDDVGAEDDVGAQFAHILAEADRLVAQMPALHALQDHVVAGLQRQMQMRHQPRLGGDGVEQIVVGLDRIDRGQPQALHVGHLLAGCVLTSLPSFGAPGRSAPKAGHVDAGQHDLGIAVAGQPLDLLDHGAHRHRARIAAAIGDDAEGAAMVAAVLHLDEGARAALDGVDHMAGGLAHRKDVVDARLLGVVDAEIRQRAIGMRLQLLLIAEHEIDLVHGGEILRARSARRSR